MMRVIINADDLGINSKVNRAIGEALRMKYITSSTIMANSEYWDEVHKIVDDNPESSFGVHLNLTEGVCLTDGAVLRKYNIVDNNNQFTKKIRTIKEYNVELLEAIEKEWDAQINKVVHIEKIQITHLDGHHHIHADFAFRNILVELSKKYNISVIRNRYCYPRNYFKNILYGIISSFPAFILCPLTKIFSSNRLAMSIKNIAENRIWRKKVHEVAFTTDYFDSYEHFIHLKKCNISNDVFIELMCHPGHNDYINEYKLIESLVLKEIYPDLKLVSYKMFTNK